jgi:hypothetical protein
MSFSAGLELAFAMERDLGGMDELQHIAGLAIACAAVCVFALMIWAGQHQS